MDKTFVDLVNSVSPDMNEQIMNGYVCHEAKDMERRLKETLFNAYDGLLEGNLRFIGINRCTPQEEYEVATRPRSPRRTFEMAKSDFVLQKLSLEYRGQPIPDPHLYTPVIGPGGTIRISGPLYNLTPVVSSKVISPEPKCLFIRLYQFKTNAYLTDHSIVVNDERTSGTIAWGRIYSQDRKSKRVVVTDALSTFPHYLFCRHGVHGVFAKYLGFTPVFGTKQEINASTYPDTDWVLVRSAYEFATPSTVRGLYRATQVVAAVPRDKWNERTKTMMMGLYYVLDNFGGQIRLDTLNHQESWLLSLGSILFNNMFTPGKIIAMTRDHFESSDTYMDEFSLSKLMEAGYPVENFTDLLAYITLNYKELKEDSGDQYYGKYLDTLRDVLYPITYSIYKHKYALVADGKRGPPALAVVKDRFQRKFSAGPIFKLISMKGKVAEAVSYSGDHLYFKMTSRLTMQESSSSSGGKSRKVLGEDHYLTTPQMMIGSILFLAKSNPVPLSHVNPYVMVDLKTGTLLENPKFKDELREVDAKLARKS